jgi:hypothetical protein
MWSFTVLFNFSYPTTCGTLTGEYVVIFNGQQTAIFSITTGSTCPSMINLSAQEYGIVTALQLYSDSTFTQTATDVDAGEPAYWRTSIVSDFIRIGSSTLLSFQSSINGTSWTQHLLQGVTLVSNPGQWSFFVIAPDAPGNYTFTVVMDLSLMSKRKDASQKLQTLKFYAVVRSGIKNPSFGAILGLVLLVGAAVAVVVVLGVRHRRRRQAIDDVPLDDLASEDHEFQHGAKYSYL